MEKQYLFVIDLDGTLLQDSKTSTISQEDQNAIKRAMDLGHKVCIATGRPWSSAKKAYETLNLDTVIANYNGGYIHNPSDYSFIQTVAEMNLNDGLYIMGDEKLKSMIGNIVVEGPGWARAQKSNEALELIFGLKDLPDYRLGLDYNKLPLRPTSIVIDLNQKEGVSELTEYLNRKYGDLVEISSWSKGEDETPVVDITAKGVTKKNALSLLSRYYDISIENTIAMGDSYNDVSMLKTAEMSVAMGNAPEDIKKICTYVCENTNKTGGVAEFI